jgi:23S rRNA (pseudouridine1915-N3)-methyltransferase
MNIMLSTVSPRRSGPTGPAIDLLQLYLDRATHYIPCAYRNFASEEKFLDYASGITARSRPALVLADSRGQQLSSEEIAKAFGFFRDAGRQQLFLAIGPADGWSSKALARADKTIAFGRITLPHELAAAVAAEQIYRALTILSGHPYHIGH